MGKFALCIVIASMIVTSPGIARIINIPADYSSIQAGINASLNDDTVLVQPGTFFEDIRFNGHNIVLGSMYIMTFDTSYIAATIIDANSEPFGINFTGSENSGAMVMGFTIQNAISFGIRCWIYSNPVLANNIISGNGLGILCFNSAATIQKNIIRNNDGGGVACFDSSPQIKNNIISENESMQGGGISCIGSSPVIDSNLISDNAAIEGGGIYFASNSQPVITANRILNNIGNGIFCTDGVDAIIKGNEISGNSAEDGAGIFCQYSDVHIDSNYITRNDAIWNGGGIYCSDFMGDMTYNVIGSNSSGNGGGGIYCQDASPVIFNNLIVENTDSIAGGGLYSVRSSPFLYNNVISHNRVISQFEGRGGGVFIRDSELGACNSIFWADTAFQGNEIYVFSGGTSFIACDVYGGWPGWGNIDVDPLFRDPDNGDYRLMATECGYPLSSPCIDAGGNRDAFLNCDWGLGTIWADLGAYGGDITSLEIDDSNSKLPDQISISQNYPNPFNPTTTIQYDLPSPTDVTIEIFDIIGRRIEILINTRQEAGHHQITWNADDVPSGVYFYRIKAGEYSETKKMLLLK